MIRVFKDWVIAADDMNYKLGTIVQVKDKETGETKDSFKFESYAGSVEQALKIILRVEKRRVTASQELTLKEAIAEFRKLYQEFEEVIKDIPEVR